MEEHKDVFDLKLAKECAEAFSQACGVGCIVSDADGKVLYESGCGYASCGICKAAGRRPEDCVQAHIYGMTEAARFGGKYIYFCPMGLTCFVSPILGNSEIQAKLTVGPFLMVERQDYISWDLQEQMGLTADPLKGVIRALERVPYFPTGRINAMSELLFMAVGFMNNISAAKKMLDTQGAEQIQGQITAYIQQLKSKGDSTPYPFEKEQALLRAVRQRNREDSLRLLNEVLSYVLPCSGGELSQIKARTYELLVLISRSAIEAGANPEKTLQADQQYLLELNQIQDFDELCFWLTRAMNTLMDSVFDFIGIRHAGIIHQSIQYINTHYARKLTLNDMARRIYLSPPYFSRIFKEETGQTFTAYLNRVRVERSRELLRREDLKLADIALMVGFEDQSYFTKVFKKLEGQSPLRYRKRADK